MEVLENPPTGKKQRNMGIELLRAVSMLMVVVLHLTGSVLPEENGPGSLYELVWLLETATYCAVNVYAMISGYVNAGARVSFGRALNMWLQTAFYSVGFGLIFAVLRPDIMTAGEWKKALMPVLYGHYWYISAYFGLMVLMPVIDMGLRHISPRRLGAVALLIPIFYIFPQFVGGMNNFATLSGGYSLIWLLILYVFGSWLGRSELARRVKPWQGLALYGAMTLLSWGLKLAGRDVFVNYTSPTVFLAAAALVAGFAGIRVGSVRVKKAVAWLSAGSLGVFLIHVNNPFFEAVTDRIPKSFPRYGGPGCLTLLLAAGAGLFLTCEIADWLRRVLFRAVRLDRAGSALDSRLARLGRDEK